MKAPKFREFISEAKVDGNLRLLIITDEPEQAKQFHTADRLKEEADKLNIDSYLFYPLLSGGFYSQFHCFYLSNKKILRKLQILKNLLNNLS